MTYPKITKFYRDGVGSYPNVCKNYWCNTPIQADRTEPNRIAILFLESYSLDYSSGRIAKADLNPPGGLRWRYDGFHTECVLVQLHREAKTIKAPNMHAHSVL